MIIENKLDNFTWIRVYHPDKDDFESLLSDYKIDEDTLNDILDPDEQPRIEPEDDYKVIIVRFPISNSEIDKIWHTEPIGIIYSKNKVITICRKRCDILDKIQFNLMESKEYFILDVINRIAERYLKSLKSLNAEVFKAKQKLTKRIRKRHLLKLLDIENSYTLYLAGLKGNSSVMEKLDKMRSFNKDEECEELLDDARVEINQAIETTVSYAKMLAAIKNTFESVINIDSNTYINRLTMWTIILIAPTIVVGFYGMNMALPFAQYESTSVVIFWMIVIMIIAYGAYSFFKKSK
jgi:magnesium transporter